MRENLWSYVTERRREAKELKTKSLLESTWKHRWNYDGEWSRKVVYFTILSRACFIGSFGRMFITFCRNIQFPCNVIEFTRVYIKSFIFNWRQLPSWLFYYMLLLDGSISSQSCRPPALWSLHSPSRNNLSRCCRCMKFPFVEVLKFKCFLSALHLTVIRPSEKQLKVEWEIIRKN